MTTTEKWAFRILGTLTVLGMLNWIFQELIREAT